MKSKRVSLQLRKKVIEFFENHCAYCQSSHELIGALFEIDHIIPQTKGGQTVEENLCWCCPLCNRYKGTYTTGVDPVSKRRVKLFHPRRQQWKRHFQWSFDGTLVIGRTVTGRATVETLNMNNDLIVPLRQFWVSVHRHPPD
jgi:hypothetical protein